MARTSAQHVHTLLARVAELSGYGTVLRATQGRFAEIEGELRKLEREETKLISDLKKAAKESPSTAKVLAKQLVRLRQNKTRMQESVAQLTGVNAGLKSQQARFCRLPMWHPAS
jgi:chromosome segregation ATPase